MKWILCFQRLAIACSNLVKLPISGIQNDKINSSSEWNLNYKYSPEPEHVIINCSNVARSGSGQTKCGSITKSVASHAIYTINYSDNMVYLSRHKLTRWSPFYIIQLNSTLLHDNHSRMWVHMTPRNVDVYIEELYFIQLLLGNNITSAFFFLSYVYTQITLMKPPYDTNCLNYKTVGLDSHAHCFDNCVFYAESQNNVKSSINFIRTNSEYQPVRTMISDYNCSRHKLIKLSNDQCDRRIRNECTAICKRKDCFKEIFEVNIEDTLYFEQTNGPLRTEIHVNAPNSLSTIIVYMEQTSLIDYITYILSCLSFWLGLCPLRCLLQLDLRKLKISMSRVFHPAYNAETQRMLGNQTPSQRNRIQFQVYVLRNQVKSLQLTTKKIVAQIGVE